MALVLCLALLTSQQAAAQLIGSWSLNETSWDGSRGEVEDQSGYARHGRVIGSVTATESPAAIAGSPGTCGFARASGGVIELTGLPVSTRYGNKTTVAFWMKWDGTNGVIPIGWRAHDIYIYGGYMGFNTWGNDIYGISTSGMANQWKHVVAEFTNGDLTRNALWIDGVKQSLSQRLGRPTSSRAYVQSTLHVGGATISYGYRFSGDVDEVRVYNGSLTQSQVSSIMAETRPCSAGSPPTPTADWRFEEASWDGTANEVLDSSDAPTYHGTSAGDAAPTSSEPAVTGDPGTCHYGSFDGAGDVIRVPHDAALNSNQLTIALWARIDGGSGTWRSPITSRGPNSAGGRSGFNLYASTSNRWEFWTGGGSVSSWDVLTGPAVTNGRWTHIAATYQTTGTRSDGTLLGTKRLYVDGVLSTTRTNAPYHAMRVSPTNPVTLGGGGYTGTEYFWDGLLDEIQIYSTPLAQSEIQTLMAATHPCPASATPDHFVIEHDGEGLYCAVEKVAVSAVDAAGDVIPTYASTVTLTTQNNKGAWTLVAGNGSLVDGAPDDGIAEYTFDEADGGTASFSLSYPDGPSKVDVDAIAHAGSVRDDDSEGALFYQPDGFVITGNALPAGASGVITDPIKDQTAGTAFAAHIAAYGSGCGLISNYTGDKSLALWVDYQNPSAGPLVPTAGTTAIGPSEAEAISQTVTFVDGQAVLKMKYKDVGSIALHAKDVDGPTASSGASNAFVSRPADFVVTKVLNNLGVANPGVVDPEGTLFARAGEDLSVTIEVRDAEGSRTPSYGKESPAEGIRLKSAALVAPAGGRNGTATDGTMGNATAFSAISPAGTFLGTTFSFDEVGAIRLQADVADRNYLGSGNISGTNSAIVGRFAPARFEITSNTPSFETACSIGAFTWMGEPFDYLSGAESQLTVRAVNAAGGTTANYTGGWWRLTNSSLANRRYSIGGSTLDDSGLPATTADPAIVDSGDGTGTLTFSTGTGLIVERSAPVAPFNAEIALSIDVLDKDATEYSTNPYVVGGTTTGAGIAFSVAKRFQYGRMRVDNAHGSELVDLPVSLRAQRYDGTGFVDDTNDSCSRITVADLGLTKSPASLASSPSIANNPLFAGVSGLEFSAPDAQGTVDLRVNLGPSGANLPWLRFDWPEDGNLDGNNDDDPSARITFGIWEGRDQLIFIRESY